MSFVLENLFDEEVTFEAGAVPSRNETQLIIAGSRTKYPRSFLSLFNIVPRTMTRYALELVNTEAITGAAFTTAYNVRRNLGLGEEPLRIDCLTSYYLDPSNEVLTLMTNNTSLDAVTTVKRRGRRVRNPVVFRQGSVPLLLIFESRKKMGVYREDVSKPAADNAYTAIGDNVVLASKYAGLNLLDVHSPSNSMTLSAVYGVKEGELHKLSNDKELTEYQKSALKDPIRMDEFNNLFESVKKSIPLTNISIVNE
ncbi:virion core protein / single-stranded DNA binding protein [Squirrelpox virus]|uniref:Core protein VP8 n=1 Tax=Squirrelpox virus TaxID=240426 RepID=U3UBJ3_9POXV|nr:virion core protein / single-stranded DNA binding protein [Squirrelpox virus]CCD83240.1 virion core protein / single-stranded DNA binding protein [Squirrelpox virus]